MAEYMIAWKCASCGEATAMSFGPEGGAVICSSCCRLGAATLAMRVNLEELEWRIMAFSGRAS